MTYYFYEVYPKTGRPTGQVDVYKLDSQKEARELLADMDSSGRWSFTENDPGNDWETTTKAFLMWR